MNDLSLFIFFALPKFAVLFVVEASHKNVSVLAEENGRSGLAFVSQRGGPHSEWGGADRATGRFSTIFICGHGNFIIFCRIKNL